MKSVLIAQQTAVSKVGNRRLTDIRGAWLSTHS
jgi:hypothetical protein